MALTQVNAGLIDSTSQPNAFKNRIINGAMMIDQRNAGASVSLGSSNVYAVDRFAAQTSVGSGHTVEQVQDAPTGFTNSYKLTVGTGATPTGTQYGRIRQSIEGYNISDLGFGSASASSITISFWVKSSVTGTFGVAVVNSDGAREYISSYAISSANTWEQKTVTVSGDTSGTWLTDNGTGLALAWDIGEGPDRSRAAGSWGAAVNFGYGLTGGTKVLATSGATFYITGVQLEKGSTATSFDYRPYGTELALCQRYYQKISGGGYVGLASGNEVNSTSANFYIGYVTPMRTTATFTQSDTLINDASANRSVTGIAGGAYGEASCYVALTVASGFTAGQACTLMCNTNGYITFSAEL